jgi:hypothetical protein
MEFLKVEPRVSCSLLILIDKWTKSNQIICSGINCAIFLIQGLEAP